MSMHAAPSHDGTKADDGMWDAMVPKLTMEVVVGSLEPAADFPRPAAGSVACQRLTDRAGTEYRSVTQQRLVLRQHDD
jgi:hypothetical protein